VRGEGRGRREREGEGEEGGAGNRTEVEKWGREGKSRRVTKPIEGEGG